jgi:hypothetical protein
MTIFRKEKKMDSPIATFPVAIGLKSDKHDPFEEIVGQDIKNMMSSKIDVIIGTVGNVPQEKIPFSAEMFVSLGDQPERRSSNKLMAGNSRAHTIWRVKLRHVLPACKECLDWMEYANVGVGNNWQGTSKECTIWMIGGMDSPLLALVQMVQKSTP